MEELEREQVGRETEAIARANEHFWKKLKRSAFGETTPGAALIGKSLPALVQAIQSEQERIKAGAKPWYWERLLSFSAEKFGLITLKVLVTSLGEWESFNKATALAHLIGECCEAERLYGEADRGEKRIVEAIFRRNKRRSNALINARTILEKLKSRASARTLIRLGGVLLQFALDHTELVQTHLRPKKPRLIHLSDQALADVEGILKTCEALVRPRHLPMIVPPTPWTHGRGGGYRRIEIPFVKREFEIEVGDALEKADLRVPSEVLSRLQETPWRINQRVLEVLRFAWRRKAPREALPLFESPPIPPCLPKETTPEEEYERRIRERAIAFNLQDQAVGNRVLMKMRIRLGRDLLAYAEFYYPQQLDHRGREYSVPQVVHPQSDDWGKALLEFARGEPLGERGAHWLAVSLANLAGKDKLSISERNRWVRENEGDIVRWARDPHSDVRLWKEADKPWRFLAAALEWEGYLREGPGFISHHPVAMDGTCNGLQHLSALGRDPKGGLWTNLVPAGRRQDIYQEVAKRLKKAVEKEARGGNELAKAWLELVDRKLVKQATMTTPYGVTETGLCDQLVGVLRESHRGRFEKEYEAAMYLAPFLDQAISAVVVKGSRIRTWLTGLAQQLAGKGLGLHWTVPTGFPVVHHYRQENAHRVRTLLGAQVVREKEDDGSKLNETKQANAIVANLVHSLDAAHLMFTVEELHKRGIRDFAMVHDSYAVHARHVDVMNTVLREQFQRLHTEFTLPGFAEQIRGQVNGIKVRNHPKLGTLDLREVLKSEYFFS